MMAVIKGFLFGSLFGLICTATSAASFSVGGVDSFCALLARALARLAPQEPERPVRRILLAPEAMAPTLLDAAILTSRPIDAQGLMNDDYQFALSLKAETFNEWIRLGDLNSIAKFLASLDITGTLTSDHFRFIAEQNVRWEKLVDQIFDTADLDSEAFIQFLLLQDLEKLFERALIATVETPPLDSAGFWTQTRGTLNISRWKALLSRIQAYGEILETHRRLRQIKNHLTSAPKSQTYLK